jgi:uncharacterized protein YbbK (DUF523 family)
MSTDSIDGRSRQESILASACLGGVECKYNGTSAGQMPSKADLEGVTLACPEELGGLGTPRPRAEIVGGDGYDVLDGKARVVTCDGEDVTSQYIAGAYRTLAIAQKSAVSIAVLQEFSPSCGRRMISDGSFTRTRVAGVGVTTALLIRNGIDVVGRIQPLSTSLDDLGKVDANSIDRTWDRYPNHQSVIPGDI